MAARLKIFTTSDGLTDYVVAVSSRAKALAAWGVRQDLFKEGRARETNDPGLIKSALARPGEVLTRPAGGKAGLTIPKPARPPVRRAGPTPAQKQRVAELERQLEALDADLDRSVADIAARRAELDVRESREHAGHETKRRALQARLVKARAAASP
jgi:hypothetical protein